MLTFTQSKGTELNTGDQPVSTISLKAITGPDFDWGSHTYQGVSKQRLAGYY